MSTLSVADMQGYLSKSLAGKNQNKLNGLLAEIDFRACVASLGFGSQVTSGGWIARSKGAPSPGFATGTVALLSEIVQPGTNYLAGRTAPPPSPSVNSVATLLHQQGVSSFYCTPEIRVLGDATSVAWTATQLGLPFSQMGIPLNCIPGFVPPKLRRNYLTNATSVGALPIAEVPTIFSKENLRVSFQQAHLAEISDVDGVFFGKAITYPLEIKEKTAAQDKYLGEWFGIDVGPFVKLAYFAAKRQNMHSLFVVREISDVTTRQLVGWWYIPFERMAQYASWVYSGGGRSMIGGASATVKIPKTQFLPLTAANLASL
jgi:hypothetical protein